ncbi:hypothetical protein IJG26_01070 [Candidatus Saccharibacteria bacterium]|nr:hypothetical protein [Candidatus Saccharibacteria bacterium]
MDNTSKKRSIVSLVAMGIIIVAVAAIIVKREWIYDLWRSIGYTPTTEMEQIRNDLDLTDRGRFLFNASRPELSDQEEFNDTCRSEEDAEMAVLGCYTEKTIYVYDINDEELKGIRELTTAHELLHAVWARMSDDEKDELDSELKQVLKDNPELSDETDNYASDEQREELYVRAGTEVKNLPAKLEKHYAEVFKEQDKIVDYYNSYIKVFRQLEDEMDAIMQEMESIETEINQKTEEYKARFTQLNVEIAKFNSCAETAGCFSNQWQFNMRRGELIAEQQALENLYDEIDQLIEKYNDDVEKYNNDVLHSNRLMKIVNSNETIEEIR